MALALFATGALGVAGFLLAGASARGAVQSVDSTRSGKTVSLRSTSLGAILVNSKGHTLYLFAKDKNGRSACSGACATYWPPVIVSSKPTAGPGVKAALLGTTKRSDGRKQVTYNHHPLYTFALDKKAGQVNGQGSTGSGARWWVVSARGAAVTKTASGTTTSTTTGTSTTDTSTNVTTTTQVPYP